MQKMAQQLQRLILGRRAVEMDGLSGRLLSCRLQISNRRQFREPAARK